MVVGQLLRVAARTISAKPRIAGDGAAGEGRRDDRPKIPLPIKVEAFDAGGVLRGGCVAGRA